MIVFIAGMPRSGSTFSFNIARDVLRARGSVYQEAPPPNISEELARCGEAEHVLFKVHQLDESGLLLARSSAARVICTIRKPEDAVSSWMQTFDQSEEDSISVIRDWLRLYIMLKPFALTISYRTVDRHPFIAARRIMRFLVPNVRLTEIWQSARQHAKAEVKKRTDALSRDGQGIKDIGFSWYDAKTFFHRRHISSLKSRSASERLPRDQVQRIRAALAEETVAAGIESVL
ncbi:MAG: hypothetical protein JO313_04885 [Verrucomicrobia bacterium]|nr:hypothetical protein [Verrucomicrobiota bacterium]